MLTTDDIRYLINELAWIDVASWDDGFHRVQKRQPGYSKDKARGRLQASLGMMLEAKLKAADEAAKLRAELGGDGG